MPLPSKLFSIRINLIIKLDLSLMSKSLTRIPVYVLADLFKLSSLSVLVVASDASFGPPFRQWCQIFVPLLKKMYLYILVKDWAQNDICCQIIPIILSLALYAQHFLYNSFFIPNLPFLSCWQRTQSVW